jgi:hypothetical protein
MIPERDFEYEQWLAELARDRGELPDEEGPTEADVEEERWLAEEGGAKALPW